MGAETMLDEVDEDRGPIQKSSDQNLRLLDAKVALRCRYPQPQSHVPQSYSTIRLSAATPSAIARRELRSRHVRNGKKPAVFRRAGSPNAKRQPIKP
jgi:hypothetical protein